MEFHCRAIYRIFKKIYFPIMALFFIFKTNSSLLAAKFRGMEFHCRAIYRIFFTKNENDVVDLVRFTGEPTSGRLFFFFFFWFFAIVFVLFCFFFCCCSFLLLVVLNFNGGAKNRRLPRPSDETGWFFFCYLFLFIYFYFLGFFYSFFLSSFLLRFLLFDLIRFFSFFSFF